MTQLPGPNRVESCTERNSTLVTTKIVIAGGFGVGKTTFVGAVSEISPVNTDRWMTQASRDVDPLQGAEKKGTTTVAMDWGRITLAPDLVLFLFGTPGQPRSGACGTTSPAERAPRSSSSTAAVWTPRSRPSTTSHTNPTSRTCPSSTAFTGS
jgi:hypothetical protein